MPIERRTANEGVELREEGDTLGDRLEELTDSVSFLLMVEDRGLPKWAAD